MKAVTIGKRFLQVPIIQGGMGVGISRAKLAAAVAREGAMGVISSAQIGFDEKDFEKNPEQANLRALKKHITDAKKQAAGRGWVAVNIMAATEDYESYVKTACAAGADAIISGAGLPTQLPSLVSDQEVKIAPIVSSKKSCQVILKYWHNKYACTADFIVIEGPLAGGHLGFKKEALEHVQALDFDQEIKSILAVVAEYEIKYNKNIPVFLAGGILNAADVRHALALGVHGVQVASRFVTTYECDATQAYKECYLKATPQDIVIVDSPVGLPGRALNNAFVQRVNKTREKISHCYHCLKVCNPQTTPYCISRALINAVKGRVDDGLIFCGARIGELKKMETVKEVIRDLNIDEP